MWQKISLFFVLSLLPLWGVALPDALLERFDIPTDATPKELVQITQERWCQKGKERWEFTPQFEEMHEELESVFRDMGYLDAVTPRQWSQVLPSATNHTFSTKMRWCGGCSRKNLSSKLWAKKQDNGKWPLS